MKRFSIQLMANPVARAMASAYQATMQLPADAAIPDDKMTKYLLVRRPRGDKSAWLGSAGYSLVAPEILAADLRAQLLSLDAQPAGSDKFGDYYETSGLLKGPSGKVLRARAIWMTEHLSGETRLITLIPDKSR
jgi:hypothetical protein